MTFTDLDVATVGHDNGLLVLHLECQLTLPPDRVRRAVVDFEQLDGDVLSSKSDRPAVADTVRWEVDEDAVGTRLAFTTWIDGTDVQAAAATGAEIHAHFDRLVRMIDADQGASASSDVGVDVRVLTDRYVVAFSEALADTD
jgi:hypothetical protein